MGKDICDRYQPLSHFDAKEYMYSVYENHVVDVLR